MTEISGLLSAFVLDGKGHGREITAAELAAWTADQGGLWVHLDCKDPSTDKWLREVAELDNYVIDGLLAEESRPRCDPYEDGTLLVLRGVNLNPGADPEDMVSIRIWIEENRIISTRVRNLMAVEDVRSQLRVGKGALSLGHLVARLAAAMTERMTPTIAELSDVSVELENQILSTETGQTIEFRDLRHQLIDCRQTAITLRRYIHPQRDALIRFVSLDEVWMDERVNGRLRETIDRVTRITEELDEIRERAALVQDELTNRISQRMEKTMYILTVVATVMLPLGFLTGLLGINVGGIPGAETPWAFWAVCAGSVVIIVVELVLLRRLRWL